MTDLELMELLEAEGYEPDVENLILLKEGIESGEIEILNEITRETKEVRKKIKTGEKVSKATPEYQRYKNNEIGHKAGTEASEYQDKKRGGQLTIKIPGQKTEYFEDGHGDWALKRGDANKKRAEIYAKNGNSLFKTVKESYSDYELYQILEENGYTTTEANLSILKEGLETGKYTITPENKNDKYLRRNNLSKEIKPQKPSRSINAYDLVRIAAIEKEREEKNKSPK